MCPPTSAPHHPGGGRADHKQTEEKFLPRKNRIVLEQHGTRNIKKKKRKKLLMSTSSSFYLLFAGDALGPLLFAAFVSVLFLALVFERLENCSIGRCRHLSCVCDVVLPPESAGGGRKTLRLDCKSGLGCQGRRLTGGYGRRAHLQKRAPARET